MPRHARIVIPGWPHHVTQCGNNRQDVFFVDGDRRACLDLLGEQIAALHREGILAPIYVSVQCDEYAANTHPEWVARGEDGRAVGADPLSPGWQILDMASPYQEYLAEQDLSPWVSLAREKFEPFRRLRRTGGTRTSK